VSNELPTQYQSPNGVEAQGAVQQFWLVEDNQTPEHLEALTDFLRRGAADLWLRQNKLGVQDQTRKDIQNLRDRAALYKSWVDDESWETLQDWVVRPVIWGDFSNVPDLYPSTPYKLPGVFDTKGQAINEIAWMYILFSQVELEQDLWQSNVETLVKDVSRATQNAAKKAIDKVDEVSTGLLLVGGGVTLAALIALLRR